MWTHIYFALLCQLFILKGIRTKKTRILSPYYSVPGTLLLDEEPNSRSPERENKYSVSESVPFIPVEELDLSGSIPPLNKIIFEDELPPITQDVDLFAFENPNDMIEGGKRFLGSTKGMRQKKGGRIKDSIYKQSVANKFWNQYIPFPTAMANLTSMIDLSTVKTMCKNLDVTTFDFNYNDDLFSAVNPSWLRNVRKIGLCPYVIRKKYLGSNVLPSYVVEWKCLCSNSTCSLYGGEYRCIAVTQLLDIWVRKEDVGSPFYKRHTTEFTVGCVCARKPSLMADSANKLLIGDRGWGAKNMRLGSIYSVSTA